MKIFKFILTSILLAIIFYIIGLAYINSHELIHQSIFRNYGIESTIKINYFKLSGVTTSIGDISSCKDSCLYQHSLNEIVGYNLAVILTASCLLFYMWFFINWYYGSEE